MKRFSTFLASFAVLMTLLTSCDEKETVKPDPIDTTFSLNNFIHTWRLDAVRKNNIVVSQDTAIDNRYTLDLRLDGTYTRNIIKTNTPSGGTWKLGVSPVTGTFVLRFTNNLNQTQEYLLTTSTAQTLQYGYTNADGDFEEYVFTALP